VSCFELYLTRKTEFGMHLATQLHNQHLQQVKATDIFKMKSFGNDIKTLYVWGNKYYVIIGITKIILISIKWFN